MVKKKILVTGAAGFIGGHLVEALVAQGLPVRCLVRKKDSLEFLPKNKIEIVFGDITNKKSLAAAVKDIDVIYHLAAKTDFEGKSWEEYYRPNVLGTQNLIDLAIAHKVERFVFFSTIRVVGLRDSTSPINESAAYNPLNFYDRSKYEAEKKLLAAYQKLKLPIVILRPTSVYGPRDRGTYYAFFKAIAHGKFFLIGNGRNLVSFVHVANVVQVALLVQDTPKAVGQIYFINDERPYPMKELACEVAEAFGRSLLNFHLPVFPAYILGYLLDWGSKLGRFKPILTPERVKNLTINYVFDISKAKKELGYRPKVILKEGIRQTAVWYQKYGWI